MITTKMTSKIRKGRLSTLFFGTVFASVFSLPALATAFDSNSYYRLTTQWQGDGKSLDVVNDGTNNKLQLAKTGNFSGQFWKITPVNGGYYRLTTQWQGDGKSLDVVNDGTNNKLQLAKTGNYSGQHWKITPANGGYYRLTTQWQGDGKSLDVINDGTNNKLQLANTGNYSGQLWKLSKAKPIRKASKPKAPSARWVNARNGSVPQGTLVSGHEVNRSKLYACRANYNGGIHPGKVSSALGACNIGWGGNEVIIRNYQTYVENAKWQAARNGNIPSTAIVGGREPNGAKLYICRGNYNGGIHSGKIRSAFGACNIGWGGKEVKVNPYQVLVK